MDACVHVDLMVFEELFARLLSHTQIMSGVLPGVRKSAYLHNFRSCFFTIISDKNMLCSEFLDIMCKDSNHLKGLK